MMKNTSRAAKMGEVHPLCSRKRSLMKIVDSPSYQKRRALEKENTQATKKSKTETPKFDFLRRKSRYGDDFLVKKPESRKSFSSKTETLKLAKRSEIELEDDGDGARTPLRVPLSAVGQKNQSLASRRRTLSHIASRPSQSQSSLSRASKKLPPSNLTKNASRPLPLPTRSPCLKKAGDNISAKTKHYPPTRSPFTKKKSNGVVTKTLPHPTCSPLVKRRHTMMPSKQQAKERHTPSVSFSLDSPTYTSTTRKPKLGTPRRCSTLPKWKPGDEEEEEEEESRCAMTPWKNSSMSMRERLDLWLASKNKCLTPHQSKSFVKSPHPNRRSKSTLTKSSTPCYLVKLSEEENGDKDVEPGNEYLESVEEDAYDEDHSVVVGELGGGISKELEELLKKADDKNLRGEVEQALNDMVEKYTTVVKLADYWICKARLAAQDDDVQRVVCMLEQAHAFQAQPGERIKEEICRYLELLEDQELNNDGTEVVDEDLLDEQRAKLISLYAITPGRRVHFAAQQSPLDFKSSVIRFCLLESKAFKRKLKEQLKRKVLTPVRRSIRVRRSEGLPEYLRTDCRVVESPGEVEDEIVEGEVSFVPNNTINTPLNNGWLLQDERETQKNEEEQDDHQKENKEEVADEGEANDDQKHDQEDEDERTDDQEEKNDQKQDQEDEDGVNGDREENDDSKNNQEDEDELTEDWEENDDRKHDQENEDRVNGDWEENDDPKTNRKDEDELTDDREENDDRKHDQEDEVGVNGDQEENDDPKQNQEDKYELKNDEEVGNELNGTEFLKDAAQEELEGEKDVEKEDVPEAKREGEEWKDQSRETKPVDERQEEQEEQTFDESALELSFM